MTHLENYLSILNVLPREVKRHMCLVQTLDSKATTIQARLDMNQKALLALMSLPAPAQPQDAKTGGAGTAQLPLPKNALEYLVAIRRDQMELFALSSEKVETVEQLRILVQAHSDLCSDNVKKLESELGPEALAGDADVEMKMVKKDGRKKHAHVHGQQRAQKAPRQDQQWIQLPEGVGEGELYCYCAQVSYGDMIGCDNDACRIQWFHFQCVGLKSQPKGKWYCDDCKFTYKI